jgi:hypothetical protein
MGVASSAPASIVLCSGLPTLVQSWGVPYFPEGAEGCLKSPPACSRTTPRSAGPRSSWPPGPCFWRASSWQACGCLAAWVACGCRQLPLGSLARTTPPSCSTGACQLAAAKESVTCSWKHPMECKVNSSACPHLPRHPLLMTLAFPVLMGEALLSYKAALLNLRDRRVAPQPALAALPRASLPPPAACPRRRHLPSPPCLPSPPPRPDALSSARAGRSGKSGTPCYRLACWCAWCWQSRRPFARTTLSGRPLSPTSTRRTRGWAVWSLCCLVSRSAG